MVKIMIQEGAGGETRLSQEHIHSVHKLWLWQISQEGLETYCQGKIVAQRSSVSWLLSMARREMAYTFSYMTDAGDNGLWSVQLGWQLWAVISGGSPESHSHALKKCALCHASLSCVLFHAFHLWPLSVLRREHNRPWSVTLSHQLKWIVFLWDSWEVDHSQVISSH